MADTWLHGRNGRGEARVGVGGDWVETVRFGIFLVAAAARHYNL